MNADHSNRDVDKDIRAFQASNAERTAPTIPIEGHFQRDERKDIDFGQCLGCMKPLQQLNRVVTGGGGHKWRCPECIESGK